MGGIWKDTKITITVERGGGLPVELVRSFERVASSPGSIASCTEVMGRALGMHFADAEHVEVDRYTRNRVGDGADSIRIVYPDGSRRKQ